MSQEESRFSHWCRAHDLVQTDLCISLRLLIEVFFQRNVTNLILFYSLGDAEVFLSISIWAKNFQAIGQRGSRQHSVFFCVAFIFDRVHASTIRPGLLGRHVTNLRKSWWVSPTPNNSGCGTGGCVAGTIAATLYSLDPRAPFLFASALALVTCQNMILSLWSPHTHK